MNDFLVKPYKYIFLLSTILFSSSSLARFMVEPSVLYTSGRFSGDNELGSFSAKGYGVSLGYAGKYFLMGLTGEKLDYSFEDHFTTHGHTKYSGGGIGTFIGLHLFDRFKIWTSYLNSTLEPTSNTSTRYFGQYYSVGLGIRILGGIMLNAQSFTNQYTQIEDDTTGKTSGLDKKLTTFGQTYSISYIFLL